MTWMRLPRAKNTTRHLVVTNADGSVPALRASRCGRMPLWYEPEGWQPASGDMHKCRHCVQLELADAAP